MITHTTSDEMNITIIDAKEALIQAMYVKDPVRKIQLVREALAELQAFDSYWSDTFEM